MPRKRDLTGQKFGRLTVIRPTDKRNGSSIIWECKCDCGNTCHVASQSLVNGRTKSCGCYDRDIHRDTLKKIRAKSYVDGTSINAMSTKLRKDSTSGVKGVTRDKKNNAWTVRIGFKGERLYIGQFKNLEDAKKARQEAEEKLYKPFLEAHKKEDSKNEK